MLERCEPAWSQRGPATSFAIQRRFHAGQIRSAFALRKRNGEVAGRFSRFRDANFSDPRRSPTKSRSAANEIVELDAHAGVRAPCEQSPFRRDWKCLMSPCTSEFSRGRFRHLRGRRPAGAALDRVQAFPSLYRLSIVVAALPAQSVSSDPAELDLVVRRNQGRGLHRACCGAPSSADSDPENVILLEIEPEKQKTRIDFACTETLLGMRPVCLTKNQETRPTIILRSRRARGADRADLQSGHLR